MRDRADPEQDYGFRPIRSCGHLRPSLPRSFHLPRASTEGSARENLNKTGVRLWTACSFDQDGKVGGRHTLDPLAHTTDRFARSNQWRRAVG